MKFKKLKKINVIVLAMAMVFTTIGAYTFNKVSAEDDSDTPDTIKMPITIYDHLNDGLLFEYPLNGVGKGLAMYNDTITDPKTGVTYQEEFWKEVEGGLISSTLDEKTGTPVYKEETVTNVAKIVKKLMDSGYDGNNGGKENNQLYKQLYKQITGMNFNEANPEVILPNQDSFAEAITPEVNRNLTYEEMGWTLKDSQGNKTDEKGKIWSLAGGDHLYAHEAGATAEINFGQLKAGNYTLQYYALNNMEANLVYGNENSTITQLNKSQYWGDNKLSFYLPEDAELKIEFTATNADAEFCNGILATDDGTKLRNNFVQYETLHTDEIVPPLSDYGITGDNTYWKVHAYGITTGNTYNSQAGEIYITKEVIPGATYKLDYINELCNIKISANDKVLSQLGIGEVHNQTQTFEVPNDADEIKITISQDSSNKEDGWRTIKQMNLTQVPTARLGTYNESATKFSDKSKGLSDVSTCYDYAYYVLNNFWSSTNNQITQKTNNYTSLTLKKDADGYYKIDQNNLVYDLENKTIYKADKSTESNGYFPLDDSTLGDKNDLSKPFGKADGEIEFNGSHNYHFATKAHTQFVYETGLEFTFSGDDDVYLFINGKKVLFKDKNDNDIDLGGAHASISGTVNIDDYAEELGLEEGKVYDMDFFHLERHSWASNFSITTNISFKEPKVNASVNFLDVNGNPITSETKVNLGTEVGIKYAVTAENVGNDKTKKMSNLSLIDKGLGVEISASGIVIPTNIDIKDKLTFKVLDKNGKPVENKVFEISKDELNDKEAVKDIISKIEVGIDETVTVEGLYTKVSTQLLSSNLEGSLIVDVDKYNDDSMKIEPTPFTASAGDIVIAVPQNTPKAKLDVELTDKLGNQLISSNLNVGDKVYVNYTLTSESLLMKGISLDDKGTGIKISKDGVTIPERYDIDDEVKIILTRKDGTTKEVVLSKEDVQNGKSISEFDIDSENAWILNNDDSIKIIGIYTTLDENNLTVHSDVVGELNGPVPSYDSETGKLDIEYKSPDLKDDASITITIKNNDPEDPTKPVDPTEPTKPEDPVTPVNPSKPEDPVTPVDPSKPEDPVTPVEPTNPTDETKVDLVLFKVNQKEEFLEGASFKVTKVVDGKEVLVGEQKDGPMFTFKQLGDGVYRVYETKSPTDYDGLDTYFEIEIKDGQIYFDDEVNQSFTIYNTNDGTDPFVLGDEIELSEYYEWLEDQNGGKEQIDVKEVKETNEPKVEETKEVKTSDEIGRAHV